MANVYESKFKGVEVDDGINTATYATGTGGINVTIKGTTNITGVSGRHLEIDGSKLETALGKKQDTITDQTSLNAAALSVNALTVNSSIEAGGAVNITADTMTFEIGPNDITFKSDFGGSVVFNNSAIFKGTPGVRFYLGDTGEYANILAPSNGTGVYDVRLPDTGGTIALTSNTVSSIGGQTGVIALSTGLAIGSNGLYCTVAGGGGSTGVSSIGGKTGVITLGTGLSISNTNVLSCTVTGVTSIGGRTGDVGLGRGIALSDTGEIENFTWEVTYQVEDLPSDLQEPEVYVSIITNLPRETLDQFTNSITFAQLKENFGPDNSSSDDGVFILNPYGYALVGRESGSGRTAVKPLLFNETNGVVFPSLQSDSGFIYSGTNSIHFTRASIRRV